MHRKKILAVAVAGALGVGAAGVAVAQTTVATPIGNVTIYGKLYPEVTITDFSNQTAAGATVSTLSAAPSGLANAKRPSIDASNSRIGFRGNEGVGGGLNVVWQIEQRVRIDTGTGALFANRDSFLGLAGGFGTVKLGFMDTAYKQVGDQLSFLGISSGNFVSNSNVLSRLGFGGGATGFDFHLRQPNSLVYESPQMGGVQVLATYSPDELKTTTKEAVLTSLGVKYEMGPLYVALGHENHKDYFGGSNNVPAAIASPVTGATVSSKDTATRATVMLKFGSTTVSADAAQMEWKETGGVSGTFANYKNTRAALGVEQKFGNITGAASVVSSPAGSCTLNGGAACSTTGLEAKQMNLGASYAFSRRTLVFAILSKLDNGASSTYNNTANATVSVGEDITQFAVGVSHSF
jgi:predicted porin